METLLKVLGVITFVMLAVAAFAVIFAYPTKWLVNYTLAPATIHGIFGVDQIGFWQALALNTLTGILFRSGSSSTGKGK